ncbi:MAG: hypothetical protein RL007_1098 [Bacteroidota bacterium]|jgi:hypothetical protein
MEMPRQLWSAMKKIFCNILLLLVLASPELKAQNNGIPIGMNFTRGFLFCDFAKLESDTHLSKKGIAPGFGFELGRYYGGDDPALDKEFFRLGWYLSAQIGWGRMKSPDYPEQKGSRWIPLNLDMGFVSRLRFGDNVEAGAHYGFLGLYGYSTVALFGSSCSARLRLWNFQMEYGREGDGIFRGCFVPRFKTHPIHHFTFIFLNKTHFSAGVKYTIFNRSTKGETPNPYLMKEFRIMIGIFI